jgi:hypothetical protein
MYVIINHVIKYETIQNKIKILEKITKADKTWVLKKSYYKIIKLIIKISKNHI